MSGTDQGPIPAGRRAAVPAHDRPVWRERIGVYLLGVAIGLVLVGVLLWGRYQAGQRRRAAEEAAGHVAPHPVEASTPAP